jgi:hypothetical protein
MFTKILDQEEEQGKEQQDLGLRSVFVLQHSYELDDEAGSDALRVVRDLERKNGAHEYWVRERT